MSDDATNELLPGRVMRVPEVQNKDRSKKKSPIVRQTVHVTLTDVYTVIMVWTESSWQVRQVHVAKLYPWLCTHHLTGIGAVPLSEVEMPT